MKSKTIFSWNNYRYSIFRIAKLSSAGITIDIPSSGYVSRTSFLTFVSISLLVILSNTQFFVTTAPYTHLSIKIEADNTVEGLTVGTVVIIVDRIVVGIVANIVVGIVVGIVVRNVVGIVVDIVVGMVVRIVVGIAVGSSRYSC